MRHVVPDEGTYQDADSGTDEGADGCSESGANADSYSGADGISDGRSRYVGRLIRRQICQQIKLRL